MLSINRRPVGELGRQTVPLVVRSLTAYWNSVDCHITVVPSLYLTIIAQQEETELLAAIERNNRESEQSNEESTGDEPALLFRARALYDCEWFKDTWDRRIAPTGSKRLNRVH
jgi:hypothetical protein